MEGGGVGREMILREAKVGGVGAAILQVVRRIYHVNLRNR